MKKLIPILLLSFHLFSSAGLEELAKLPILFEHYYEHKALNNQITFVKYLVDHYNEIPHTDNDEERDNQLPFKSPDQHPGGHLSHLAIPQQYKINLRVFAFSNQEQTIKYREEYIPNSYQSKIWQPPKV